MTGNDVSLNAEFAFDNLIYLHGSTCERETSQVMTFAHELQHFVQYGLRREVWAANTLLMNLPRRVPGLALKAWNIPIEIEARIVSKRIAEALFGQDAVREYVQVRIQEANAFGDENDRSDWEYVQNISIPRTYDLNAETHKAFQKHRHFKNQLEELKIAANDQEFMRIDLDVLCS